MHKPILVLCLLFYSFVSSAEVQLTNGYIKTMPAKAKNSAVYFDLTSHFPEEVSLIDVSTDSAVRAEIHQHIEQQGMMKMRKLDSIPLLPHQQVSFEPMGLHIMLIGLTSALHVGEMVVLTLHFSNGHTLKKRIDVKAVNPQISVSHKHNSVMHH